MPFSFKPTEANTGEQAQVPNVEGVIPPSNISSSSSKDTFSTRFSAEGRGIVQTVLMAVFGFSILVTIVLFGYNFYLNSQIDNKKAELDNYEKQFGSLQLQDMQALSSRMKMVSTLVKEHPSVRVAFRLLEDSVENPVIYKSFDLHFSESSHAYELSLAANAPDYHSVVNQMDTFKRKPFSDYVKNVVISGLKPDTSGKVTFNLKMPITITGVLPEGLTSKDVPQATSSISVATSTINSIKVSTSTTSTSTSNVTTKKP